MALSPPTIKVSVPPVAPGVEPVQGASRKCTPLAVSLAPILRLALGEMVEASAITLPACAPSMAPPGPRITSSDMAVSPTHTNVHSACAATCLGVSQKVPFSAAASSLALAAVFDHSATWCPARNKLRAIGYPISPKPRKPSFAIDSSRRNPQLYDDAAVCDNCRSK